MSEPKATPPPVDVSDTEVVKPHASGMGPQGNALAAACYVPLVGAIVWALEKSSPFVRFHALQATLVHAVLAAAGFILVFVIFAGATVADAFGTMRWAVVGLLGIAIAGLLGWCMAKAARWEVPQLPVVGEFSYARTLARLPGK